MKSLKKATWKISRNGYFVKFWEHYANLEIQQRFKKFIKGQRKNKLPLKYGGKVAYNYENLNADADLTIVRKAYARG